MNAIFSLIKTFVLLLHIKSNNLIMILQLQDLATTMLELWDLMDTPVEEQQMFQNITCNIAASENEITEPNTLSVDVINYVSYMQPQLLRLDFFIFYGSEYIK